MQIKRFISPILDENMYLLIRDNKCAVIDPGSTNLKDLIEYIKQNNLKLECILLTHGHFDHILGIEELIKYKEVPVYIGEEDIKFLYDSNYSLSKWVSMDFKLSDNIKITPIVDLDYVFGLKCLSTPGHTKGSTCYLDEETKSLFTGDTLFKRAYGRVDFPTGNARELRDSLNNIFKLDGDIKIYAGHGESSTISEEKNNYYGIY